MRTRPAKRSLRVAGLFAGIGGLDLGFERMGHQSVLMSEWDPAAMAVLQMHFPNVILKGDVREIETLPPVDLVTGGFPCQDISQAGTRDGLVGARSGMVWEFFRLIEASKPEFFILENVSNLLSLKSGSAMRILLQTIEHVGYRWAYRLVDTRGFRIPQRRQRVIILASRGATKPEDVLLNEQFTPEHDDTPVEPGENNAYGFYWTEGRRGVGWTENAVPTIKGGSGLGIPSPPAVYLTKHRFAGTPSIEDAERLQGFDPGWTDLEMDGKPFRPGVRWRLVGNAVSVPISEWLGEELAKPTHQSARDQVEFVPIQEGKPLPRAAFGDCSGWHGARVTTHVRSSIHTPIDQFLVDPLKPLSKRALGGYLARASQTTRRIPARFLSDLREQYALMENV